MSPRPRSPRRDPAAALALDPSLEFMRLVWALDHGLQTASKRMESLLGLTGPQRLTIRVLGALGRLSAGELSGVLHVHPSTLTGVVKRLQARGLIERQSDPLDGRRVMLGLTDAGRALDTPHEGTVEAAAQRTLARVPALAVDGARQVLQVLAEELSRDARHQEAGK